MITAALLVMCLFIVLMISISIIHDARVSRERQEKERKEREKQEYLEHLCSLYTDDSYDRSR
jgi:hypothetical protein